MLDRAKRNVVVVALANKLARMAWAVMSSKRAFKQLPPWRRDDLGSAEQVFAWQFGCRRSAGGMKQDGPTVDRRSTNLSSGNGPSEAVYLVRIERANLHLGRALSAEAGYVDADRLRRLD
jgi:hypothetical protein